MATASLNASIRNDRGTGVARKLRQSGNVPAIIYGHGREPQSLASGQTSNRPALRFLKKSQVWEDSGGLGPLAEVLADPFRPPTRLCRHITDQPAPLRARDCRTVAALQTHQTLIGIEVGDRAQQQGFARSGWSLDGNTLAPSPS